MTHYLLEHNFLKFLCFAPLSGYHPFCHFKCILKLFSPCSLSKPFSLFADFHGNYKRSVLKRTNQMFLCRLLVFVLNLHRKLLYKF